MVPSEAAKKKAIGSKKNIEEDTDFVVRRRSWNARSRRWSNEWEILLRKSEQDGQSKTFQLPCGGSFTVHLNLLTLEEQEELIHELVDENAHLFRQYRIQGGWEPRVHFLLHSEATDADFETSVQPGYKYGAITMKAKPLSLLPKLEQLSIQLLEIANVDSWNIGVNPVVSSKKTKVASTLGDRCLDSFFACLRENHSLTVVVSITSTVLSWV